MRTLAVTVLAVITIAGGALAQPATLLKYKFVTGTTLRYADTMIVHTTQEMMGQEMKMSQNLAAVTRYVVEAVTPDGGAKLLNSTDTMRINVKNPRVDTTIVPTEVFHKRNRLTVTPLGDVTAREVVDSLTLTPFMRASGGVGTRELLRMPVLSEKPVKPGDTWTSSKVDSTKSEGGTSVITTTVEYRMKGTEKYAGRTCAVLSYTGNMTVNTKGSMMGMDVFTEGTGTMSGVAYFDRGAGVFVGDVGKSEMELTAAVTGQQNMTIPISQTTTMKHVLLPD